VLGAAALGACASSSSTDDAGALTSAQAFVHDASAFRFESVVHTTYSNDFSDYGDPETGSTSSVPEWASGGPGSTTTDRTVASGTWTPDAWQVVADGPFGHEEVRTFGTTSYFRSDFDNSSGLWQVGEIPPMSRQDLLDELESMHDGMAADGAGDDAFVVTSVPGDEVAIAASVYLGGLSGPGSDLATEPAGYLEAITDLGTPAETTREGDTVTVTAEVTAPDDVERAWGEPLPSGSVALKVGPDGVPLSFTLRVESGDDVFDVEVRYSDWNVPRDIVRPGDDEIDRTPWIDEEALAAVPGIQLLRPTALPAGWSLDYADVVSAEDSAEGCQQVELGWSPATVATGPADVDTFDHVSLYLLPEACAMRYDSTPFTVGEFAPIPSREGEDATEVLIGGTVVQIDSSLTGAQLAELVRSLAPTDVAALVDEAGQVPSAPLLTS
jgi:hypothetical protein